MSFQIHGRVVMSGHPLPPLRTQVANATQAARRLGAAAIRGERIWRTPAQREEWRAICESNECGYFREKGQRCTHPNCGCFTKLKRMLATERCPAGLFPRPFTNGGNPPAA
jgi:hypothetical protein